MKKEYKQLGLWALAGFVVLYLIDRMKKSPKNFANMTFGGDEVQFMLTNNTMVPQRARLFDYTGAGNNPNVSITAASLPSVDYFNKSLPEEPKLVDSIQLTSSSIGKSHPMATGEQAMAHPEKATSASSIDLSSQGQITKAIQSVCLDANGNSNTQNYTPTLSPYQHLTNTVLIKPKNMLLDGKCYLELDIEPLTTLVLNLGYTTKKPEKK